MPFVVSCYHTVIHSAFYCVTVYATAAHVRGGTSEEVVDCVGWHVADQTHDFKFGCSVDDVIMFLFVHSPGPQQTEQLVQCLSAGHPSPRSPGPRVTDGARLPKDVLELGRNLSIQEPGSNASSTR